MPIWSNWSGSVQCAGQQLVTAHSETEVVACVRRARQEGMGLRVVGTGHSFVPLCASEGVLLSLDGLQGVLATRQEEATVWAGTKIHQLGDPLWALGLAMANMGDIDRQAIAGAVSTGTHGTGRTLGSISTQVTGLRLVIASGEIIECSPSQEPEIFQAAQVSLGALGVITQISLRCLPAYHLHQRTWVAGFDECLAELENLIASNRHFEFFWSPGEDACAMKTLNPVALSEKEQRQLPIRYPAQSNVQGRLKRYVGDESIDRSYRIFPSERNLKFNEMEFAVPYANGPDCLCEMRELMQRKHRAVLWPIEYRTLAADEIWLSPASGRESVTISIHQAVELPHQAFFADAEAIFRNHRGRPHWGKMHSHGATDLRRLYPQWEAFLDIRRHLDPEGCFLNQYLQSLGIEN